MSSFRYSITSQLKSQRPNLSESSLRTYTSVLFNLHKHMRDSGDDDANTANVRGNIEWFSNNWAEILIYLNRNIKKSTRKSVLSALYVLTNRPEYHEQMIQDAKDINAEYKEQKKTEKQEANWISLQDIEDIYNQLHEKAQQMMKKNALVKVDVIVQYLLVGLLGGHLMPPRRSLDVALLKWKNYDKKLDNYYHKGKLYFNKYKTSDKYGLAVVDVPKELDIILKKWLKMNPSEYVLISSNGKSLSSSQITRMLNKIFGRNVSVNMLRHIFLTNFYRNMPKLTEMQRVAAKMGHNITTAMEYAKKD